MQLCMYTYIVRLCVLLNLYIVLIYTQSACVAIYFVVISMKFVQNLTILCFIRFYSSLRSCIHFQADWHIAVLLENSIRYESAIFIQ